MEFGRYALLTFLLLAVAGGLYYGLMSESPTVNNLSSKADQPDSEQSISNFTLNENLDDGEIWRLRAPEATRLSSSIELRSPHVVYTVDGDTRLIVDAESGTYRMNDRTLILSGDVRLKRLKQNQILLTDKLKWHRDTETVTTRKSVRLETPEGILTARGMRTHIEEDTIQFLSDVKFSSR